MYILGQEKVFKTGKMPQMGIELGTLKLQASALFKIISLTENQEVRTQKA